MIEEKKDLNPVINIICVQLKFAKISLLPYKTASSTFWHSSMTFLEMKA
jgi:hypothetical protein